jgi:hypothetical protein
MVTRFTNLVLGTIIRSWWQKIHKFENLNYQQLPVGEENELTPVN